MTAPPDPQAKSTMRKLGGAAMIMVTAMLLSRIIGQLRQTYIGAKFGAGPNTDAFLTAFTLPDLLNYILAGGALSITFLPIYSRYLADDNVKEGNRVFSIVASVMLVLVVTGLVLGEIFTAPIVGALYHPKDPETLAACIRYTRIVLPAQMCFIIGPLASATLLARGRFLAVAVAPLIYNLGIIGGAFFFGDSLGVESMAWGAVAGAIVGPLLFPLVDAVRHGLRFRFSFNLRHPSFIAWIKLSLPLMVGISLTTSDNWVIRYFAGGDEGAITHLDFAKKVSLAAIAIAGQAVGQASLPFFARLFAEGKRQELVSTFVTTLTAAVVASTLLAALMVGLAEPMVTILFGYGKFSAADLAATTTYAAIFAAAIPIWTMQALTTRLFYAAGNTLTPMVASTIMMAISLPVFVIAMTTMGVAGLAVASGVGIILNAAAMLWLAPRILPELAGSKRKIFDQLARGVVLAALAGATAHGALRGVLALELPHTGLFGALLAGSVGGLAFLLVIALAARPLKVDVPLAIARRLRKRFG